MILGNDKSCVGLGLWFPAVIRVGDSKGAIWMWGVSDAKLHGLVSCRRPPLRGAQKANHKQFQKPGKWQQQPCHMWKPRNTSKARLAIGTQGNATIGPPSPNKADHGPADGNEELWMPFTQQPMSMSSKINSRNVLMFCDGRFTVANWIVVLTAFVLNYVCTTQRYIHQETFCRGKKWVAINSFRRH